MSHLAFLCASLCLQFITSTQYSGAFSYRPNSDALKGFQEN